MLPARFTIVCLLLITTFLASAAVFNFIVDPYSIFGMPRRAGFNAQKPNADSHTGMVKTYQLERVSPRTVLIGSSKVDIGLDPDHPAWPQSARPVYNYGVPGSGVLGAFHQLQRAAEAGQLRTAIIGLELEAFLDPRVAPGNSAMQPDGDRASQRLIDSIRATLTLRALFDSIDTVLEQRRPNLGDVNEHGLTNDGPLDRVARADGYYDLFARKNAEIISKTERAARALADTPPWDIADLEYVRAIMGYCRERNIRLYFFIHPHHANLLEIIDRTGLWDRFEFWKIALARLVEEYRLQAGSPPIVLWDFASYDGYTTEAIPARGDRNSAMKWFWEPSHYKKALGDIMLSRMLGESEANFGAELTSFSIDRRLAGIREARRAYREANPGEVEQIAEMARKARELRKVPLILR